MASKETGDKTMETGDEDNPVNVGPSVGLFSHSILKLYSSKFLTAWGDRLWAFGLGLLLYRIRPSDLLLVSIYGLTQSIASLLFGASIGTWIDRNTRLTAAKTFLVVQNCSVALACAALAAFFHWQQDLEDSIGSLATPAIAVITMFFAILSTLASMGSKVVVEKDWIVVIAGGDMDRLAKLNAIIRTIDLVCLTVTPALAGLLFQFTSYVFVAIFIGAWNIVSVLIEFLLLTSLYREFSDLSSAKPVAPEPESSEGGLVASLTGSVTGWLFYLRHRTLSAGLGLALLYCTVLGFDNTTWAFCLMQCVSESVLGALVAVSALLGLTGSLAFPPLRACLGIQRTGVLGMMALVSSLSLCVASIWLPGSPFDPFRVSHLVQGNETIGQEDLGSDALDIDCDNHLVMSVIFLLTGIILARFGLWIADLSISQIQQEEVVEEKRGVIGGVQTSLNQFFNVTKFLLVIFLPDPHTFGILIIISFAFVSAGAISMIVYAGKTGALSCKSNYQPAATKEPAALEV